MPSSTKPYENRNGSLQVRTAARAADAQEVVIATGAAEAISKVMKVAEPMASMLRLTRRERLADWPLLTLAAQWFESCRGLRQWECDNLSDAPKAEVLRVHRVQISDLIADGEIIAWQARQESVNFSPAGFKVEDVEAEVQLLRDSFAMFHTPMPKGEAEQLLEAAFGK
jgi:hypothetical protein